MGRGGEERGGVGGVRRGGGVWERRMGLDEKGDGVGSEGGWREEGKDGERREGSREGQGEGSVTQQQGW